MKLVSIITVNFNQSKVTEALLKSIYATTTYKRLEIIVIDNGSKINATPDLKTTYPDVIFIRSDINLGFAGGNNLGVAAAKGDYLFFVNNDTEFTPGLIENLVAVLDKHELVGMVSPKIRYFDQPDMLQYMGYTGMNYFTARNNCIGQYETDNGQYDNLTGETGYVHGAAMMVKKECIEKAGPMAENFFLYYEELDWCDHIKKAGYQIWLVTNALIYHKESVSVGKNSALKEYFMNRNRILFIRRNAPALAKIIFYFYYLLVVSPRNIWQYLKTGHSGYIKWLVKAIWWNITEKKNSRNLGYPINKL
ncbi:glycosyltransferase family 2 protein [Mucilaginibacter sp. UR6-11]|uniref:glycosyltransferase family 2 protein n=1 Tax=Mucilaginibacter sp. UR6-11 TaxID=1435644 RepID=UPI001E4E9D50|nr:glycosyltransferase family 2 protein [Mucilaginibacter sp. UR6-11]MCC8423758.1 glycosyltransferase family 2 protein [Mucilaginibacter sp. UR6-11]